MGKVRMLRPRIKTLDLRRVLPPPRRGSDDPIYQSAEYRTWRDEVVSRANGYCQDPQCKYPNRRPSRLFADHIIAVKDDRSRVFDLTNGLARCGSCHSRKTHEEGAARMSEGGGV